MSREIYKYPMLAGPDDGAVIDMPDGAQVVRFSMQNKVPTMWALVDPAAPLKSRAFRIYGTGRSVPNTATYLGSVDDGPWVWHLFELPL